MLVSRQEILVGDYPGKRIVLRHDGGILQYWLVLARYVVKKAVGNTTDYLMFECLNTHHWVLRMDCVNLKINQNVVDARIEKIDALGRSKHKHCRYNRCIFCGGGRERNVF